MFMSHHSYAIEIEQIMCNVFNCDIYGFGGIVDANFIDRNPYSAISCALAVYYNYVHEGKKVLIDKYLKDYSPYRDDSISGIGEEKITEIIDAFKKVLKLIQIE